MIESAAKVNRHGLDISTLQKGTLYIIEGGLKGVYQHKKRDDGVNVFKSEDGTHLIDAIDNCVIRAVPIHVQADLTF